MTTVQGSLFGGPKQRVDIGPDEFGLACSIADLLRRWLRDDWKFSHFPAGEHRTAATGARLQRMGVQRGWPDYILVAPTGIVHFIELKRTKGYLSEPQKEFSAWCGKHGVIHEVVRSVDNAMTVLNNWGALRFYRKP